MDSDGENGVSIILPTYNEAGNIVELVERIIAEMPKTTSFQVIIVDDNSPDGTYELVKSHFSQRQEIVPILREQDRGFAKSIRHGINSAHYDRLIIMDSDLTHDPKEIQHLLHVGEIYDIVSGSRFCSGGGMVDTKHYMVSMAFNWFLRLILRTQVQDNLGGYFFIRKSRINNLPLDDIFFGYGEYFFRLLHFAKRDGMSIVEIPALYLPRGTGTSNSNWSKMFLSYTKSALTVRKMP